MDAKTIHMIRQGVYFSIRAYAQENNPITSKWTSACAEIAVMEDLTVLAFKGSKEIGDFIVDMTAFPPMKYGTGWMHLGFALAHKSIWKRVLERLDPTKPLLVTGHSLGAVMAEKSCDFLRHFDEVHMVTFGKPNGHLKGTAPGLSYLDTQISVVSGSDVVARIPRYLFGPSKTQKLFYMPDRGPARLDPSKRYLRKDWKLHRAVTHHSMSEYKARVKQFV